MTLPKQLLALGTLAALVATTPLAAQTATIDWNAVYQRIDGFGASCAYTGIPWTDAQADLLFSADTGIGLSLLRSKVTADVTGTGTATKMAASSAEITIMQKVQARGARVWSAPWSPPAQFKTSGNTIGGNFVAANNQAYADMLADYAATLKNQYGINLYAISVQNEPDWTPTTYEGCGWSAQQIHDFVPYLYNSLRAKGAGATRILLPESLHWQSNQTLFTTTLNDPAVAPMVGIIGNHNYDGPNELTGATSTPAALPHAGKALWETEVMTSNPFDGSMANGLYWAQRLHLFLTAAGVNAWHYWWFTPYGDNNGALLGNNWQTTKRLYVLGQYSKFVRPGYYRIGVTNPGGALISAYKDPETGKFAIVAVNSTSSDVTQTFTLTNFQASAVTPWRTSETADLAPQADLGVTNGTFTATLPANSVTTFAGADSTPKPTLGSSRILNLSIRSHAGVGSQTLIASFVVRGGSKPLLIRSAGPILATYFHVPGALMQTQLGLYNQATSALLSTNAGWDSGSVADTALIRQTTAALTFPFDPGSADSALVTTLDGGSYSAQATGVNGTTGIALVEVYDANVGVGGRLVNASARTQVGVGDNVLIAGFVLRGTEKKTLLIRGVGPSLINWGITDALPDPQLDVVAKDGTLIARNTVWGSANPAVLAGTGRNVGAFDLINDSLDSAVIVTLDPNEYSGQYSAIVRGVSGDTGVALVEIYEVQ